ncbi:ninja-family protein AFP3-like, partial [Primulina huaijiensis]|uniref:ninja-family protein AFP3-like n=1 Tax=Primulina huaijiensis TaxID=1492673 RepID=UPI003CC6E1E5
GRFGVDKSCKNLVRSSSIAVCSHVVRDDSDNVKSTPITGLVRTSSLPVETEEEWRKRKGLQTLRRMEAKRRRSEKQRNLRGDKEVGGIYGGGGGSLSSEAESAVKSFGSISRAARRAICGSGTDVAMAKVASPGSGSSSCVSDSEGKFRQGSSDEPSPTTSTGPLKVHNQDACSSGSKSQENTSKTTGSDISASPSKKSDTSRTGGRKVGTNAIEEMPCVFTVGDGPNGRRVDGILYEYGKGEVRIMCICCGKFRSPAEFVGHAGGTDLDHPLKHIVVNSYASPLL